MRYFWDTNIFLAFIRESDFYFQLDNKYDFFSEENESGLSVVSVGELLSLSLKRKWGSRKIEKMESLFDSLELFEIFNEETLDSYAQIDAYSQSKHLTLSLPLGMTARNMGKNDIWIAATAHAIGADLVTTDKDFDHLDGIFLNVISG